MRELSRSGHTERSDVMRGYGVLTKFVIVSHALASIPSADGPSNVRNTHAHRSGGNFGGNFRNPYLFRDTMKKLIESPVLEYKKLTAA
jgi:hypothetical protein